MEGIGEPSLAGAQGPLPFIDPGQMAQMSIAQRFQVVTDRQQTQQMLYSTTQQMGLGQIDKQEQLFRPFVNNMFGGAIATAVPFSNNVSSIHSNAAGFGSAVPAPAPVGAAAAAAAAAPTARHPAGNAQPLRAPPQPAVPKPSMPLHLPVGRGKGRPSKSPAAKSGPTVAEESTRPATGGAAAFKEQELLDLISIAAPMYKDGKRSNIDWEQVAQQLMDKRHRQRTSVAVRGKFSEMYKTYQAARTDDRGTGNNIPTHALRLSLLGTTHGMHC